MDLIYAWIASIASGIEPIIIKASSKSLITNPWLFNVLWVAFGIPLVALFAILHGAGIPKDWWLVVAIAISAAGFYILYTLALYKMDVSVMAPLFSLRTVFAVLLGVLLLHEKISAVSGLLIIVIVLASPFAAYDEHLKLKAYMQKPILLAGIAMFSLALMGYFTNLSAHTNGYATTLLWQDTFVLIVLLPTLKFAHITQGTLTRKKLLPFILLGIMAFLYTASVTKAYAVNLALSSAIVSLPLSMLFVVLLSFKYGEWLEKHPVHVYVVRFTAGLTMVVSAIMLSTVK